MTKEDIASFSDVISRFLSVLNSVGFSTEHDYTWGTGGNYDYWIISDTGWYIGDTELKIYMRAPSTNPTSLSINYCKSIWFYDDYDQYGNLIGRKVSIDGSVNIGTLSGTGTCYYTATSNIAYFATPNNTHLFIRGYKPHKYTRTWAIYYNLRTYGDYPYGAIISGGWLHDTQTGYILTTRARMSSDFIEPVIYNMYYCTAPNWTVFSVGDAKYFKVRDFNIALPANGDEGTDIGSAKVVDWEDADPVTGLDATEIAIEPADIYVIEAVDMGITKRIPVVKLSIS